VGVQAVRWGRRGSVRAGDYIFLCGKGTKIINWEQEFFVHHKIVSSFKRVEFVSNRMLYIVLRGRLSNIIVLNVHEPNEEKNDYLKDIFYEELEQFSKIFISAILKFC
jgi:hypothetical protein